MRARRGQFSLRWIVTVAVIVVVVLSGAYVALHFARPSVVVTEAVTGPVVQAFYSTGTIQPEREFPIKSNTAGILTAVLVDKGTHVKKGQPLAVVSDPSLVFTKDKAQAELNEKLQRAQDKTSPVLGEFDAKIEAANAMLEIAKREEQRLREAAGVSAASSTDLDRATTRVKEMWSQVESLKAQRAAKKLELDREVDVAKSALSIAQWNLDEQNLKSPVDGVVLDRPTSIGTRVAINDAIMRVADVTPENLVMRAAVDEEDVANVSVGQMVRMTLYSFTGRVFTGTVTKIYDQADPERRTFEIDVRLNQPNDRLSPGMTGELAFVMAAKDSAIVIPAQAVQNGSIYLVRHDRLTKIPAQLGIKSVERVEVLSGLQNGDRVVISPAADMPEGKRVRPEYMDPATAAGLNKPAVASSGFKGFQ
jgi:multidrug efflux pump subunit AcrA (membrane-fusion protein)